MVAARFLFLQAAKAAAKAAKREATRPVVVFIDRDDPAARVCG
jgi:AmiR/NasT family two-component response regulator